MGWMGPAWPCMLFGPGGPLDAALGRGPRWGLAGWWLLSRPHRELGGGTFLSRRQSRWCLCGSHAERGWGRRSRHPVYRQGTTNTV